MGVILKGVVVLPKLISVTCICNITSSNISSVKNPKVFAKCNRLSIAVLPKTPKISFKKLEAMFRGCLPKFNK